MENFYRDPSPARDRGSGTRSFPIRNVRPRVTYDRNFPLSRFAGTDGLRAAATAAAVEESSSSSVSGSGQSPRPTEVIEVTMTSFHSRDVPSARAVARTLAGPDRSSSSSPSPSPPPRSRRTRRTKTIENLRQTPHGRPPTRRLPNDTTSR